MKPEMTGSEIPPDSTVENSKKTSSSAESGEISHIEKVIQRSMEKVFDRKIKTLEKNMDARFDILQKVIKISYQNLSNSRIETINFVYFARWRGQLMFA